MQLSQIRDVSQVDEAAQFFVVLYVNDLDLDCAQQVIVIQLIPFWGRKAIRSLYREVAS